MDDLIYRIVSSWLRASGPVLLDLLALLSGLSQARLDAAWALMWESMFKQGRLSSFLL